MRACTPDNNKKILFFKDLTIKDTTLAGGKGASLAEMASAGIPVPQGFVILSTAFEDFLESNELVPVIDSILGHVDIKNIESIERASEDIKAFMLAATIPKKIEQDIKESFSTLGAKFVAVRSSATAEDSASDAWAGQLESYLNTPAKDLIENVKRCWASLFTPRAIFYRIEKGMAGTKVSVAVVVQKMVDSEISGIAFSVHPVTQDENQLLIEAGLGLGEAIVSGQITPDNYVIHKKDGVIIEKNANEQERKLVRASVGGNKWVEVHSTGQKLSDPEIMELSGIILKIESHYGFPCDVEWAYEKKKFYIVQSRPITTLDSGNMADEAKKETIASHARAKESHPLKDEYDLVYKTQTTPFFPICFCGLAYTRNFKALSGLDEQFKPLFAIIKEGTVNWFFHKDCRETGAKVFQSFLDNKRIALVKKKEKMLSKKLLGLIACDIDKLFSGDSLNKPGEKKINEIFRAYCEYVYYLDCPGFILQLYFAEGFKEKLIKSIASKPAEEQARIGSLIFSSNRFTNYEKFLKSIHAKKPDAKAIANKYFWLIHDYLGQIIDETYVKEQISQLKKGVALEHSADIMQAEERLKELAGLRKIFPQVLWQELKGVQETLYLYNERKKEILNRVNIFIRKLIERSYPGKSLRDMHDEFYQLSPDEIIKSLKHESIESQELRNKKWIYMIKDEKITEGAKEYFRLLDSQSKASGLTGLTASPGVVRGKVQIILNISQIQKFKEGNILLAPFTNVNYLPIMKKASAILTEVGGSTSHAAIVSRELKKPCIVGIKNALELIMDGETLEVDADKGIIRKLDAGAELEKSGSSIGSAQKNICDEFLEEVREDTLLKFSGNFIPFPVMVDFFWYYMGDGSAANAYPAIFFFMKNGSVAFISHDKYRLASIEGLRAYLKDNSWLNLTEARYKNHTKQIDREYSRQVMKENFKNESEEALLKLSKVIYALQKELIKNTLFIEQVDMIALKAVLKGKKEADIKKLWELAQLTDFYSFDTRKNEAIIKAKQKKIGYEELVFTLANYTQIPDREEILEELAKYDITTLWEEIANAREIIGKNKTELKKKLPMLDKEEAKIYKFLHWVIQARDERREFISKSQIILYLAGQELASRLGIPKGLVKFMTPYEVVQGKDGMLKNLESITRRKEMDFAMLTYGDKSITADFNNAKEYLARISERLVQSERRESTTDGIRGDIGNKGIATGRARLVMNSEHYKQFKEGEVLVTGMTRPELVPLMKKSVAIVTDEGGITSHAAIVSRELHKPCIIGTKIATEVLKTGDLVEVDATNGVVKVIEPAAGVVVRGIKHDDEKKSFIEYLKRTPMDLQKASTSPFMIDLVYSAYTDSAEITGFRVGQVMAHLKARVFSQIIPDAVLENFADKVFDRSQKDNRYIERLMSGHKRARENLAKLWKAFDAKKNKGQDDYRMFYGPFIQLCIKWWKYALFGEEKGKIIDNRIVPEFAKSRDLSIAQASDIVAVLSHPDEQSIFAKERVEFYGLCLQAAALGKKRKGLRGKKPASLLQDKTFRNRVQKYCSAYFFKNTDFVDRKVITPDSAIQEMVAEYRSRGKAGMLKDLKDISASNKKILKRKKYLMRSLKLTGKEKRMMRFASQLIAWSDERKLGMSMQCYYVFEMLHQMARLVNASYDDLIDMRTKEVGLLLGGEKVRAEDALGKAAEKIFVYRGGSFYKCYSGEDAKAMWGIIHKVPAAEKGLKGVVASKGQEKEKISGRARIISDPSRQAFKKGEILVTSMTRIEFVPLMKRAKAIITDEGGMACHAAIISRELGVPCIIGTKTGTRVIKDGDSVEVDINSGIVTILKKNSQNSHKGRCPEI